MRKFADAAKWCLVGLLIGLAIVNSRAADPWDSTDKALAAVALTATVVDWGQTRTIAKNPDTWFEKNPLLGEHPTLGEVNRHFALGILAGAAIAHYLPSAGRKTFLTVLSVIEIGVTANNHRIGIRVGF